MRPAKIRRIATEETRTVTDLLTGYILHPASANMPWHGKTNLRGTCAIAAVALCARLKAKGLEASPIHGLFDPPEPTKGFNHQITDRKHCWVICHNGSTEVGIYLCDPTIQQFFQTPRETLVVTPHQSCLMGFIPKSQPKTFKAWPDHCHPFAKNALGCDHQSWLANHQKPWSKI